MCHTNISRDLRPRVVVRLGRVGPQPEVSFRRLTRQIGVAHVTRSVLGRIES